MEQALKVLFAIILTGKITLSATTSETKSSTKAPEDNVIVSEDILFYGKL